MVPYAAAHNYMPTLVEIDVMPSGQNSVPTDGVGLKFGHVQWQTGFDKREVCSEELVSM